MAAPGREALTYRDLVRLCDDVASELARLGVNGTDTVVLVCSNGPAAAAAFLAISSCAVCAPLNPGYRAEEFAFYLTDLRPRIVLVEAGLDSAVRSASESHGVPVLDLVTRPSTPAGSFELRGSGPATAPEASPRFEGEVALLLHTSGTTSRPKLVPLTHSNLIASARNIAAGLNLTDTDRCLNMMPLFHIHGLGASLLATMWSGGSVVCCPGFVAPRIFEWMEEFRPTWYTAVPAIHQSVLARAAASGGVPPNRSLRFIRSCSAALPPSLMHELENVFQVPVVEAYGMTEAAHQMASNPLPPRQRQPGSVGTAAGTEIAVMDESGSLLSCRALGEVVVRGENVMPGYVANPEANRTAFQAGWFRTGDQGYLDDHGYLFLTGRLKEIINRAGEKISPREIDEVLLRHAAVARAAAFPVAHARLGEAVCAAVVLRPGHAATSSELRHFAAQHLADFKVPEQILLVEEIPAGPTGKVRRSELAAKLGITEISDEAPTEANYVAPRTAAETELAAIFAETLSVPRIGARDNFFALGGDSLLAVILLSRVREWAGVDLPVTGFLEAPTVEGVCDKLSSIQPAGDGGVDVDLLRVTVQAGDGGPALFCAPGSYGNYMAFCNLARHLDKDQPVIAFRLPEAAKDGVIYTIEELAARYVREVLSVQSTGPYHLAGACTGGFVVFEMARQLLAAGKAVETLALLDCYNLAWGKELPAKEKLAYRIRALRKRAGHHRQHLGNHSRGDMIAYLRPRFAAFAATFRERSAEAAFRLLVNAGAAIPGRLMDSRIVIRYAAAKYTPGGWPGRLILFRVEEPRDEAYDYPDMGWLGSAGGGSEIHDVPGSHLSMLAEANVEAIASRLRPLLRKDALVNPVGGQESR